MRSNERKGEPNPAPRDLALPKKKRRKSSSGKNSLEELKILSAKNWESCDVIGINVLVNEVARHFSNLRDWELANRAGYAQKIPCDY